MIDDEDANTIFALSSGAPPAAIAIIRISGRAAGAALVALAGKLTEPRYASLRPLRDPADGTLLDRALVLWNPAPASATGEDIAELHCHGGRAVVAAVLATLDRMSGLRPAKPGEFTRRALENGRIDLAEAEGLADLLTAETEFQRRLAIGHADGGLSRTVERWRDKLVEIAAAVEATIEYGDEDESVTVDVRPAIDALLTEITAATKSPPTERIREGVRVVIAGSPNAGKSTLLNAMIGRPAALVSDVPGTTRDIIEVPIDLGGMPFLLSDTAGLRDTDDVVESLGVAAARQHIDRADILLWLDAADPPQHERCVRVASKVDLVAAFETADVRVSGTTGHGIDTLLQLLLQVGQDIMVNSREMLNARQRSCMFGVASSLTAAAASSDMLITAEELKHAARALDGLTGRADVETLLDLLFSRFCIGK